jgi:hypothetical protein
VGGRLDVIAGFSRIDPTRLDHVRQALHTFGPVYAGFLLPLAAQGQDVWLRPMNLVGLNAPASWGPHCAVITAIDDLLATVITWGGTQLVDVGWLQVYGDEYWSVVSSDWTGPGGRAPSGFDVAGLFSAMASLSA